VIPYASMETVNEKANKDRGVLLSATEKLEEASQIMEGIGKELEDTVKPLRQGIIKRHPTFFLLLVTVGLVATMTGIEQILIQYELLGSNPWIILLIGLSLMLLTGTLYKKLG
jgi:hypothetical protein